MNNLYQSFGFMKGNIYMNVIDNYKSGNIRKRDTVGNSSIKFVNWFHI